MNQYNVTASDANVPALKILAHTVTGAITKAENVNAKLFPNKRIAEYTVRLVKRNVR
jgi:hypothetical protein